MTFVVCGMAALGAAAALVLSAFEDSIVYFYSPTDVAEHKPPPDRRFRIGGIVVKDSVIRGADAISVSFRVTDTANTIDVAYTGVLPDLFREGQGVVAEGAARRGRAVSRRRSARQARRDIHAQGGRGRAEGIGKVARRGGGRRMIAEIGHFALILAFLLAAIQGTVPMIGAARGDPAMMAVARPAALLQLGLVAAAFLALIHAFVVSDFSVELVARHSHTLKPLIYKITGVWANHEGSMVLWVLILALFGAMIAGFGRQPSGGAPGQECSPCTAWWRRDFSPLSCSPPTRSSACPRHRPRVRDSTPCSRIPVSPSIHPSSISAMSGSRSRFPSPSPP